MVKLLLMSLAALQLVACSAPNAQYYRLNPQELPAATKKCQQTGFNNANCQELQGVALQINQMAYELQSRPQGFGQKILALQQALATSQQNAQLPENALLIKKIKQQLRQRLAIVKWLESPQ